MHLHVQANASFFQLYQNGPKMFSFAFQSQRWADQNRSIPDSIDNTGVEQLHKKSLNDKI